MERLNSQVESTSKALADYVSRLDKELQERKEVQELLESFTYQQKQQLKSTKTNLEVAQQDVSYIDLLYDVLHLGTQKEAAEGKADERRAQISFG